MKRLLYLKAKWIQGENLTPDEFQEVAAAAKINGTVESEEARVFLRCLEGNVGWDAHTRALAGKRTYQKFLTKLVKLPRQAVSSPA